MHSRQILVFIFLALFSSLAFSGLTQPAPVNVDLDNLFADGDQWTARTDDDNDVFIGCGIRKFDNGLGGATAFGFCQAEDDEGERAFCNTFNAELLDAMASTSAFAYLTFSYNEDGECTRIGNSTQSFYLPNIEVEDDDEEDDD